MRKGGQEGEGKSDDRKGGEWGNEYKELGDGCDVGEFNLLVLALVLMTGASPCDRG